MSWRPSGWNGARIAHNALRDNEPWLEDEHTACREAGASAILESLTKHGAYTNGTAPILSINVLLGEKGWIVFIPDKDTAREVVNG